MKSLLNICGIADSLQLVVESPSLKEPELRLLRQPFAVIGRDPRADVFLDRAEVSRRHVYLQMVEGRAFWIDLESRTGSRDETKPRKFGWLEGGHTLGVGPYVIRRSAADSLTARDPEDDELPRNTPLIAQAYSRVPLPEVTLEFLNGPSKSTSWPVHRVMSLIGSASGCKFRLTDPSVSRFHGSLLRMPAGVWIVDLLGKGGITVNEVPIRSHRLMDGEVLGIGRYQLRIRCRLQDRGIGTELSEQGRSMVVVRPPRQDDDSTTRKFPEWAASALTLGTPAKGPSKEIQFPLPRPARPVPSFPDVEIMSVDASFPFQSPQSGLTESVLVPLVNQFGLMQQQMFDQFQQAMAMMVQMFGTMHRDQMEVIRAELDRLHELTDEFHALKDELAKRTLERESPGSDEPSERNRIAVTVSGVSSRPSSNGTHKPAGDLGAAQVESASAIPSQPPTSGGRDPQPIQEPRIAPMATAPSSSPLVSPPQSAERAQEPGIGTRPRSDVARSATNPDRDTILWLHQRIITLQHERESRWQKILKLFPGVS